jgi:hypothetical protein
MKTVKITVPITTVDLPVFPPVNPPKYETKNRFYTNLIGILDVYSKELTLSQVLEISETFREIKKCESLNTDLILPKDNFSKIKVIVEKTKGWGNVEAMLEIIEAFMNAEELDNV